MDDTHDWIRLAAERSRSGSQAVLDEFVAEVAVEKATTLSQLGLRLDRVTARLRDLREGRGPAEREARLSADREARAELLALRWEMTVVKEAMGLRGIRAEMDRHWPIPRPLE